MTSEKAVSVDRYLEMAEHAGRVRQALDSAPNVDARGVLVAVRGDSIVLTGFVRHPGDIAELRRIAETVTEPDVLDEIAVAVGRPPRMDLPEGELLLPSPAASRGHVAPARR